MGVGYLDFLHGIVLAVFLALDLVDRGEGALAHLANHLKLFHFVN